MTKRQWEKLANGSLVEVYVPGWGWADAVVADEEEGRGRVSFRLAAPGLGGWQSFSLYPPLSAVRERPEKKRSRSSGVELYRRLQEMQSRYKKPLPWKNTLGARQRAWADIYAGF